ncbi:MAG: FAD-dependent oxidoreductase [Gemmatimonadota bacterium]
MSRDVAVVGAGIFGVTAALELNARGHRVSLIDPGPLPHPLAASTDISKVIRMEYGPDAVYMELVEESLEGWSAWNQRWIEEGIGELYRETGVLMLCRAPMSEGGFEYESWRKLLERGHKPERLDAETITRRFPAWSTKRYVDGFFHAKGGYAESGRVVEALARWARQEGVSLLDNRRVVALVEDGVRVVGVRCHDGQEIRADEVVLAAGAWSGKLLPELSHSIASTGHPVFHLRPRDPELFASERFPTFTADVARTGYYGFPLSRDGIVKIANHGLGTPIDPDAPRAVTERDERELRAFLKETFPALADAEVAFTRLCLYADTQDEDLWIARDPTREGFSVASGGSGHGFKFAPVLGRLIADAVEGVSNRTQRKFGWRPDLVLGQGREAARCHIPDEAT